LWNEKQIMVSRIEQIRTFLKDNPNDSFLRHALALEYVKLGEDALAESLFVALLEEDPGYVGSYYHLAKLLERKGESSLAMKWYEKGIDAARAKNDRHALNELQAAYDELID
jgi:Tfp pilus assembly protein PilF